MIFIGVDPGASGAIAALDDQGGVLIAEQLEVMRDQGTGWIDARNLGEHIRAVTRDRASQRVIAYVERVGAMPGQGVSTMFAFGTYFGSILATVQASGVEMKLITPAVWKKAMGLTLAKAARSENRGTNQKLKKQISVQAAQRRFPMIHFKKTGDGLAEALLLADYARRIENGSGGIWANQAKPLVLS